MFHSFFLRNYNLIPFFREEEVDNLVARPFGGMAAQYALGLGLGLRNYRHRYGPAHIASRFTNDASSPNPEADPIRRLCAREQTGA